MSGAKAWFPSNMHDIMNITLLKENSDLESFIIIKNRLQKQVSLIESARLSLFKQTQNQINKIINNPQKRKKTYLMSLNGFQINEENLTSGMRVIENNFTDPVLLLNK